MVSFLSHLTQLTDILKEGHQHIDQTVTPVIDYHGLHRIDPLILSTCDLTSILMQISQVISYLTSSTVLIECTLDLLKILTNYSLSETWSLRY